MQCSRKTNEYFTNQKTNGTTLKCCSNMPNESFSGDPVTQSTYMGTPSFGNLIKKVTRNSSVVKNIRYSRRHAQQKLITISSENGNQQRTAG